MNIKIALNTLFLCCLINSTINAQGIKDENKYGEQLYLIDGNILKEKNKYGKNLFYWNGEEIKSKNKYGNSFYYLNGSTVKLENKYGDRLYEFDGYYIRYRDKYGPKIWYLDGLGSHDTELVNPYLASVSSFLATFETPPVICDLGCGDFNIGKELIKYSKKYIAIDIVPVLIAHNKKEFKADNLEFQALDIAKDALPAGDCVILRQVLQHLSNAEIKCVVEKLYDFKYVVLTEHLPEEDFEPNKDIISGQGIRLKKQSGVNLLAPPFNFIVKEEKQLLSVKSPSFKGVLVTKLYKTR